MYTRADWTALWLKLEYTMRPLAWEDPALWETLQEAQRLVGVQLAKYLP